MLDDSRGWSRTAVQVWTAHVDREAVEDFGGRMTGKQRKSASWADTWRGESRGPGADSARALGRNIQVDLTDRWTQGRKRKGRRRG